MKFFITAVSPQRNSLFNLASLLQTGFGRRQHCIMWVGIVEVTELISIHWPVRDKVRDFQPTSFPWIFSTRKSKAHRSLPSTTIGTPRYLPKLLEIPKPSSLLTISIEALEAWGGKNTLDLAELIFWPKALQKVSRTFLMAWQLFLLALANRIKSSAKNRWVKEGPFLEALIPVQRPPFTSTWMS